jgi:hypothetical protein
MQHSQDQERETTQKKQQISLKTSLQYSPGPTVLKEFILFGSVVDPDPGGQK